MFEQAGIKGEEGRNKPKKENNHAATPLKNVFSLWYNSLTGTKRFNHNTVQKKEEKKETT